ncbi:hypothetical protein D3C73_1492810 [compost metagenome]
MQNRRLDVVLLGTLGSGGSDDADAQCHREGHGSACEARAETVLGDGHGHGGLPRTPETGLIVSADLVILGRRADEIPEDA